jgi:hypothetical protein
MAHPGYDQTKITLKDSGKREEFATGAVRDRREGKGRFDLLPLEGIRRLAEVFERGCEKYGERNWEQGMPVARYLDSALRHTLQYLDGHADEDHLGQAAWNLIAAITTEERAMVGRLPKALLPENRRLYLNEDEHEGH